MNALRYFMLFLVICNIASIAKIGLGDLAGTLTSYATYLLLLVYYFLSKKRLLPWPLIIFTLLYYSISGLINVNDAELFFNEFVKYMIIVVASSEIARDSKMRDFLIMLILGASTILIHAVFFADDYGRYSGNYWDPNEASFICLMGCCLTYGIKNTKLRLVILLYLTLCGLLTFSRTFFLLWILANIIAIIHDVKNLQASGLGFLTLIIILSLSSILQLNTGRLSFVESIVGDDTGVNIEEANSDSRTETWSIYYDDVLKNPIFGNGFRSFSGISGVKIGCHNTYLRIIGESGIIPFSIYVGILLFILRRSIKLFKPKIYLLLLVVSLMLLQLTTHTFDTSNYIIMITVWLYIQATTSTSDFNEQVQKT